MNKEFRKRLKPMNSLTNMETAEKIIYLETKDYNEKWGKRAFAGSQTPR
jgi:transposase-like protein